MKLIKRDVCLWDGKKSTPEEKKLVQKGLKEGELSLKFKGLALVFIPMTGAKGMKPTGEAKEDWCKLPYGASVELN